VDQDEKFKVNATGFLNGHKAALDALEIAISRVALAKQPPPNLKEVFKAIGYAAGECLDLLDYYDERHPMPKDLRAIKDCALVLHATPLNR
jgi:hypothetical protein